MLRFGIPVDEHIAYECQQAGGAVPAPREVEQLGRLIDELRRVLGRREVRMHDELIEEAQIRHDAAHSEFP